MLTDTQRQHIVDVADSWIKAKTPYRGWSCVKGAGADCGQLLKGVFEEAGHCKDGVQLPANYSLQLAHHRRDTTYIDYVRKYMREIQESEAQAGDVVVYKLGLSFGHAAIIGNWPDYIIHAVEHDGVCAGHGKNLKFGKLEKQFYTLKDEYIGK